MCAGEGVLRVARRAVGRGTRAGCGPDGPVRLTVAASGDLLIHTPIAQRALQLGGGRRYDFAPLFAPVRRRIAEADLALCHIETPLVPGPVQGYPSFSTPPDLARSVRRVGWDVCSTASNHSLDAGQYGVGTTLRALRRAGREGHRNRALGARARTHDHAAGAGRARGVPVLHRGLERPGGAAPMERELRRAAPHPGRRPARPPPRSAHRDREPALGQRVRALGHAAAAGARAAGSRARRRSTRSSGSTPTWCSRSGA